MSDVDMLRVKRKKIFKDGKIKARPLSSSHTFLVTSERVLSWLSPGSYLVVHGNICPFPKPFTAQFLHWFSQAPEVAECLCLFSFVMSCECQILQVSMSKKISSLFLILSIYSHFVSNFFNNIRAPSMI